MLPLNDLCAWALAYAAKGYPVFPCVPGAKHPLTPNGFKSATVDPAQLEAWWRAHPQANIGVPTAGLLLLDIDGKQNPWLCGDPRLADLAVAPTAQTPRGGLHHLFAQPAGRSWPCTTGKLAPGVDTRANGGYVVVAPSVINGVPYRWLFETELPDPPDKLPHPPAWLVEMLDQIGEQPTAAAVVPGNLIPLSQRNSTLARLAGAMRRVGMTESEIRAALTTVNTDRCQPPLDQREVVQVAKSIARYQPNEVSVAIAEDHYSQDCEKKPATIFGSATILCKEVTTMCKPIIHGLLREGEIMNIIAAPKVGKSFMVVNLALSVSTGRPWFDFPTESGRVLLLDNELHAETLADRIRRVAAAMQLPLEQTADTFFVKVLRGQLEDLFRMEQYFHALPEGYFKLIILDAFYRFMPRDMDENDNGAMACLYNLLDRCAAYLHCAFVLIHHTTKGIQSGKSITDVGAGAGAQSRATDTHLILRPHQQDGCLSVDAVTRSWPLPQPFVIRQTFPLWTPDPSLDPAELRRPEQYNRTQTVATPPAKEWTPESFVAQFIGQEPKSRTRIVFDAEQAGLSSRKATRFLELAEEAGLIHPWVIGPQKTPGFATGEQPAEELPQDDSKRAAVQAALTQNPELSTKDVAERCGVSWQYANRVRKGTR